MDVSLTAMFCLQGERLSHAVGCAFAICLERKQKRDKDSTTNVAVTYSQDRTTFERTGSFRQTTMTERITDPQSAILAGKWKPSKNYNLEERRGSVGSTFDS